MVLSIHSASVTGHIVFTYLEIYLGFRSDSKPQVFVSPLAGTVNNMATDKIFFGRGGSPSCDHFLSNHKRVTSLSGEI